MSTILVLWVMTHQSDKLGWKVYSAIASQHDKQDRTRPRGHVSLMIAPTYPSIWRNYFPLSYEMLSSIWPRSEWPAEGGLGWLLNWREVQCIREIAGWAGHFIVCHMWEPCDVAFSCQLCSERNLRPLGYLWIKSSVERKMEGLIALEFRTSRSLVWLRNLV